MRVDDVDHHRQTARKCVNEPVERGHRVCISARRRAGGNLRERALRARCLRVPTLQRWPRKELLKTSTLAAVAAMRRGLCITKPRQWVVPPLASDTVATIHYIAPDHHAAADAGSKDHAEDHRTLPRSGAIDRLTECQAIGVIGHAHRARQARGNVCRKRLAIHA